MNIVKASKNHVCKRCSDDIWRGNFYYPQRKGKALCLDCGSDRKTPNKRGPIKSSITSLLFWWR